MKTRNDSLTVVKVMKSCGNPKWWFAGRKEKGYSPRISGGRVDISIVRSPFSSSFFLFWFNEISEEKKQHIKHKNKTIKTKHEPGGLQFVARM